jgi:glucan biosynthesis protein
MALEYSVHFSGESQPASLKSLATVQRTDITRRDDGLIDFGVTFAPSKDGSTLAAPSDVELMTIRAELVEKTITQIEGSSWKVQLTIRPVTEKDPVELRATLVANGKPVSETWTYLAAQDPPPYRYPNVYTRQD